MKRSLALLRYSSLPLGAELGTLSIRLDLQRAFWTHIHTYVCMYDDPALLIIQADDQCDSPHGTNIIIL